MNDAISELQITQAADITRRGEFFTITCRRMKKAMEISSLRSAAAKQRFSKPHANTQQTHEDESESEDDFPPDPGGGLPRGATVAMAATANCGFASAERPSEAEVTAYAAVIGLAEWRAKDWFHEMEGCGWLDHNKRPVAKWQAVLNRVRTKWEADGRPSGPPAAKSSVGGVNRPMNAMELKTIIAAKTVIADKLKNSHCSETGLGTSWNSDDARKKWKQLRAEIRELNEKLAGLA